MVRKRQGEPTSLRQIAAEELDPGLAAERLNVPVKDLTGIELPRTNPDNVPPKSRAEYKVVGQRIARFDLPDKVSGRYVYIQHVRVPGMLHGRVVDCGLAVNPAIVESQIMGMSNHGASLGAEGGGGI